MSHKSMNIGTAMLQPGRKASGTVEIIPAAEMPMVLTLEQLGPNPDNPRTTRNPRYEEIKASINARGLDTVPKVTRDPEGDPNKFIFSDGGNTRYQILTELWRETGEERFYRIHVLFKPWPGRLQCVIGHLAENEVRGDLSFIEKAQGIHKARTICEEQLDKQVSLRELSKLLTEQGLPIDASSISRMENALTHLYPWMPDLLESGLGRPQVNYLLAIRQDAEKLWQQFYLLSESSNKGFTDVFGECCRKFNSPELWSPEMFRDELIGDLLQALPHPELNYDRWMMELDPKERNRRYHFGEPEASISNHEPAPAGTACVEKRAPATESTSPPAESKLLQAALRTTEDVQPVGNKGTPAPASRQKVQPDGSPIPDDSENVAPSHEPDDNDSDETFISMLVPGAEDEDEIPCPDTHVAGEAIWPIPVYQDDIEHLQNMAFMTAWELGEKLGCEDEILPDRDSCLSPGYRAAGNQCSAPAAFLLSLAGYCPTSGLDAVLIGGTAAQDVPVLDDENAIKLLRLMRVMRRLRELQRGVTITEEDRDE